MNTLNLSLFFSTILHLRPEEILYRIWYEIRARSSSRLRSDLDLIPDGIDWTSLKSDTLFLSYTWWDGNEIAQGCFRFLNETAEYNADINW